MKPLNSVHISLGELLEQFPTWELTTGNRIDTGQLVDKTKLSHEERQQAFYALFEASTLLQADRSIWLCEHPEERWIDGGFPSTKYRLSAPGQIAQWRREQGQECNQMLMERSKPWVRFGG
jgi:hypothetical protein